MYLSFPDRADHRAWAGSSGGTAFIRPSSHPASTEPTNHHSNANVVDAKASGMEVRNTTIGDSDPRISWRAKGRSGGATKSRPRSATTIRTTSIPLTALA